MNLSERIRKIRQLRGFKQTTLASNLKITQQAYSCFEKAGSSLPRYATLLKICKELNVDMSFLLSTEIPVTYETIELYANVSYASLFWKVHELQEKAKKDAILIEGYESLLINRNEEGTTLEV